MRDDLDIPMPSMSPGGTSGTSYRVPRQRQGIDPNTRRMAMMAAGIFGAFVVLAGAWSLIGHHKDGLPVIEADSRPLREKPANAGGMDTVGRDAALLAGTNDAQAKLAPPTEAPDPQALKPAPAVPAPLAPMPAAVATTAQPATAAPAALPATASPAPAAIAPRAPAAAPLAALPQEHGPRLPALPPDRPAQAAARTEPPPAPAAAAHPPARTASAIAPAHAGRAEVQLGAVVSEQAARSEWQRLAHKMPALLGSRKPTFSKFERDGRTYWRIRTGGFADLGAARQFCAEVAAHKGACTASAT
jgi:hypothetical protein